MSNLQRSVSGWVGAVVVLSGVACSPGDGPGSGAIAAGGTTSSTGGLGGPASGGGGTTGGSPATLGGMGAGGRLGSGGGAASGGLFGGSGGASSGGASLGVGGTAATGGGAGCVPDPSCEPQPPSTGDFHADCVARVNQFRACMCLGPLARNTEAEECASQQAQYDFENETYHGGIRAKICSPPSLNNAAQNECPDYPSVDSTIGLCHQQMFDEGQCDDFEVCGHYLNITDDGAKSVACGYYETPSGNVWMVENFYF